MKELFNVYKKERNSEKILSNVSMEEAKKKLRPGKYFFVCTKPNRFRKMKKFYARIEKHLRPGGGKPEFYKTLRI